MEGQPKNAYVLFSSAVARVKEPFCLACQDEVSIGHAARTLCLAQIEPASQAPVEKQITALAHQLIHNSLFPGMLSVWPLSPDAAFAETKLQTPKLS